MAKKKTEKIVYGVIWFVTYLVVFMVGYIIFDIVIKGLPPFRGFLTQMPSKSGSQGYTASNHRYFLSGDRDRGNCTPAWHCLGHILNEYSRPSTFTRMYKAWNKYTGRRSFNCFWVFGMGLLCLRWALANRYLQAALRLPAWFFQPS